MTEPTELINVDTSPTDIVRLGSQEVAGYRGVLEKGSAVATELAKLITDRKLYTVIRQKKYVHAEGWCTAGACLGITPREVGTVESATAPGEFIATVEAVRTSDGVVVGQASASCGPDEKDWKGRSRQARRSMALTRATSKVFRLQLSWIMQLAGYEVTPVEEMGDLEPEPHPTPAASATAPQTPARANRSASDMWAAVQQRWGKWHTGGKGAFREWCETVCGREFSDVDGGDYGFRSDDYSRCMAALHRQEEIAGE